VLLAYAKLTLKEQLLGSDVPDDPYLARELMRYFPSRMREAHRASIEAHRLKREIVATGLANSLINRGGPTFITRLADQTGADAALIARAFAAARDVFGLPALNDQIDALDARIGGMDQIGLYLAVQDLLSEALVWFVRHADFAGGLEAVIGRFKSGVDALSAQLPALMPPSLAAEAEGAQRLWMARGVPEGLATRIAFLPFEAAIPDIVLVCERTGRPLGDAAGAWFGLADRFRIGRLDASARAIATSDYYDALALDRARGALAQAHRTLTAESLSHPRGLEGWLSDHARAVERTLSTVGEITGAATLTVARFTVAAGLIGDLVEG
jgi:glutamate dehydrogenase